MISQLLEKIQAMSVAELFAQIAIVVGLIGALIEKSKKLPFNPWSAIFRWIGSKANEPVYKELQVIKENHNDTTKLIDSIKENYTQTISEIKLDYSNQVKCLKEDYSTRIDQLEYNYNNRLDILERNADEKEAKRLRSNIICFSDACRQAKQAGENIHTKQHFENIFRDFDDYDKYCKLHNFENHFIDGEMLFIKNIYAEKCEDNSFK